MRQVGTHKGTVYVFSYEDRLAGWIQNDLDGKMEALVKSLSGTHEGVYSISASYDYDRDCIIVSVHVMPLQYVLALPRTKLPTSYDVTGVLLLNYLLEEFSEYTVDVKG